MTKKQRYYEYLYRRLVLNHVEWNGKEKFIHREMKLSPDLKELLDQIAVRYGITFHKNAVLNLEKFQLWRENFGVFEDSENAEAATYFVLYCCLADKILDAQRFTRQEKEIVYQDIKNFWNYSYNEKGKFSELYKIRKKTLDFLTRKGKVQKERYKILRDKIDRALISECFMYNYSLKDFKSDMDMHNILDKSVEFVSASFLISIWDIFGKEEIETTDLIGEIFGYMDDICDYVLDLETGTLNLALFICVNEKADFLLRERIAESVSNTEVMIGLLEDKVKRLQNRIGTQMYLYLLDELWNWTGDIRKYITKHS